MVQKVPPKDESKKVKRKLSNRIHHFLSRGEYEYYVFLFLEFDKSIINVYEQFLSLPREQTVCIASDIGLVHLRCTVNIKEGTSKLFKVMSTDFYVEKEGESGTCLDRDPNTLIGRISL